ncbi:MAG: hypothetical protein A3H63_01170 [Candidatus Harrisonbacteria bacterium RIFCSPLOWO2_02_FULL_45_10c]|uniref:Uncharacterized protein n=1 Tax=Candidatus Harrisonbacteria bacterium RIFCSPLOWO2_02_FULL_45_10c TaxID=1798410 RepID=A0A1G1ZRE7_9BACT|nr:MAG: hypothetical protein A3H63_01170 [Candidatus Harrisonbacteria bacterium RIFCSPLOWO2_02_FULL_45_10c]
MIVYLYGPDSYRRQEKLKEYLERYKAQYKGLSLSYFYLDQEGDFFKLKDFSQSQSLFESSRVGMISGIKDLDETYQKDLIKLCKENLKSQDLTLIISEEKKLAKEFNFLLEKPVIAESFEELKEKEFSDFFQKAAQSRNLRFDTESRDFLLRAYGSDSRGLIQELDLLSLLDEKTITKKVLDNHASITSPPDIFSLLGEFVYGQRVGSRLSALEILFDHSEDPAKIFNMLAIMARTSPEKNKMADYDAAIKSGKLEYPEVLLELALTTQ